MKMAPIHCSLWLSALLVFLFGNASHARTIKIWPDEERGSGVTYGGDVKLTLFRISSSDIDLVNQRFAQDLGMDLVRIPMVAHWTKENGNYGKVRDFADNAKNQHGMQVFLSIANTDGTFNPSQSGNLRDAHNGNKFPASLKCSGCAGLYGINLLLYRGYIKNLINDRLGSSNIDLVGPWNEDPAAERDYTRLEDFGSQPVVGVESWGLNDARGKYLAIQNAIDIAGSHNYVSGGNTPDLKEAYDGWTKFVLAGTKPEWFTETTLYDKGTALGIAHMLPAISAGVQKMVIYKAVPRLIGVDGSDGKHFAATKHLVDFSKEKGPALRIETSSSNGIVAAFKEGNTLHIHLCNVDLNSQRSMAINLQNGFTINSMSTVAYGDDSISISIPTPSIQNSGARIVVQVPKKTYVHITAFGLTGTGGPSPTPQPPSPTPRPTVPPQSPPPPPPTPPSPTPPTSSSGVSLIQNKATGRFLWGDASSLSVAASFGSPSSDPAVQWTDEAKGNTDYVFLVHEASGERLFGEGDGSEVKLQTTSNQKAQWKFVNTGDGYFRLEHRKTGYWLYNSQNSGVVELVESSTTNDGTKWKLVAA